MLPDMKSVWPVIVRCDLHRKSHAIANILDKRVASPPIPLSNLVRKDQFCVSVDAAPQPEIAAFFFWIPQPASMRPDVLPLLIHFDSEARQITKVCVHVISERFACFTNDAKDGVLPDVKHSPDCIDWSAFAKR